MRYRLRVNPIRCDGYGLCADIFPQHVDLDEWGYPIIDAEPFGERLVREARRAVRACPRLALEIEKVPDQPGLDRT